MPLIPTWGGRGRLIIVSFRLVCLRSEFQAIQRYIERHLPQESTAIEVALVLLGIIGKYIIGKSSSFPNYSYPTNI